MTGPSFNVGTTATAAAVTKATPFVVTIPVGVLQDDTMFVSVMLFTYAPTSPGISLTPSGGAWTQQGGLQSTAVDSGLQAFGGLWTRKAGASESGETLTFQFTGTTGATDQYWWSATFASYSGSGGVEQVLGTAGTIADTFASPDVTTETDGDWAVYFFGDCVDGSGAITGPATGTTMRENANTAGVADAVMDSNASVGNAGTVIGGTAPTTTNASHWWTAFTVALSPMPTGVSGSGGVALPKMGLQGQYIPPNSGSVSLPKMSLSGIGNLKIPSSGSVTIPKMSLSGSDDRLVAVYSSTDSNGVDTYNVTSSMNGPGTQAMRILRPTAPDTAYLPSFMYTLPVAPGLDATFGDGLDEIRTHGLHNTYNMTLVEPTFAIDPWYADDPTDPNQRYESFMVALAGWVKANLSTDGIENHNVIGFSKSGVGGQYLVLKHPDVFWTAITWDLPADMSGYDTFGADSEDAYGTDANFQANYRLTTEFLAAHAAPFTTDNRIWIGAGQLYNDQVADFDTLLTANGMLHTYPAQVTRDHNWTSGWVEEALGDVMTPSSITGTGLITIPKMSLSGSGKETIGGSGSITIPKPSLQGHSVQVNRVSELFMFSQV